jgi:GT2 family glycosyltransferase
MSPSTQHGGRPKRGRVSVIVPVHNGPAYLHQALQSALSQDYQDLEVIVVDDGSTDASPRIIDGFGDRLTVLRHARNQGLATARNSGLAAASGELIQFLDADDLLPAHKLATQARLLRQRPELALVFCEGRYQGHAGDESALEEFTSGEDVTPSLLRNNFIMVHAALVRRDGLDRIGGFREELPCLEDWDLWLRLALAGYRFGFDPETLVHSRLHAGRMSEDTHRMRRARVDVLENAAELMTRAGHPLAATVGPGLSEACYAYGSQLLSLGDRSAGRSAIRRALECDPEGIRAWGKRLHLALSYLLPAASIHPLLRSLKRLPGGRSEA